MDQQNAYGIMLAKLRAHRYTMEVIAKALDGFEVTATDWLLLGAIKKYERSVSPTELAHELQVTKPLISRSIKKLSGKGFLSITKDQTDKRGRHVILTQTGEKLLQDSEPRVRAALTQWLSPISRDDIDVYIRVVLQVAYEL